ncbi:MAG: glycosyltransferase family 2 protein [Candidatus Aureabacteria bacterium]|nr:glycosyltransferase family 2 protein [Candidatus Auribacterota bacterium]
MEKILDIIIITYNSGDVTLPCLDSVIKSDSSDAFNIVVVDNNSQDATPHILKNAQKRMPNRITSRFEKTNLGFARACNIGAGLFNSKFILFLNPDTLIEDKTALIQMVNFMRADEKVAVAGPRILNDSRGIEHTCRRFPSLSRVFLDECRTYKLFPSKKSFRGTRITDWDHNDTREVAQVIGACFMTRRTIFYELGGFDERFFMYYEEVDYCYRAKKKGYKVYFFSPAAIIHKGGYSSMQESETGTLDIYRYRYESLVAFYKKHFKSYVFFLYVILIPSLLVKFFIEYFLYAVTRNRDYAIISFSHLKAWKYVFFSFFHTKNPEITHSRKKP